MFGSKYIRGVFGHAVRRTPLGARTRPGWLRISPLVLTSAQAIVYTERVRFFPPPTVSALVGGADITSALRQVLQLQTEDAFAKVSPRPVPIRRGSHASASCVQHLAYEDMCFVGEKDGERRDAVFGDEKGLSWSVFLAAALKPVEAAINASKTLSSDGVQQHDAARAARELRCVCLC
jgi:hypothetical protein